MCGRYELDLKIKDLIGYYQLENQSFNFEARMEVFPSQILPVILPNKQLGLFKWGLDEIWTKKAIINSRLETVDEKKTTRQAFQTQRCIIPMTAFFEWDQDKIRHRFSSLKEPIQSIAGVYKHYQNEDQGVYAGFSILTMAANYQMAPIHDRMPVVLYQNQINPYLDQQTPIQDLKENLLQVNPVWNIQKLSS